MKEFNKNKENIDGNISTSTSILNPYNNTNTNLNLNEFKSNVSKSKDEEVVQKKEFKFKINHKKKDNSKIDSNKLNTNLNENIEANTTLYESNSVSQNAIKSFENKISNLKINKANTNVHNNTNDFLNKKRVIFKCTNLALNTLNPMNTNKNKSKNTAENDIVKRYNLDKSYYKKLPLKVSNETDIVSKLFLIKKKINHTITFKSKSKDNCLFNKGRFDSKNKKKSKFKTKKVINTGKSMLYKGIKIVI